MHVGIEYIITKSQNIDKDISCITSYNFKRGLKYQIKLGNLQSILNLLV